MFSILGLMGNGARYSQELYDLRGSALVSCKAVMRRTARNLVFTLSTALALMGIEQPRGLKGGKSSNCLYAVVGGNSERTHLKGVCFVIWGVELDTVFVDHGRVECAAPVYVWAMYSTRLSLEELIALGDSMMRRDGRVRRACLEDFRAMLNRLRECVGQGGRKRAVRGIRNMEMALRAMREGTDSSQESRTRIALMKYGLPCPEVNYLVRDEKTGRVFLLDMAYPEWKVVVEYDGGHHAGQWLADSERRKRIEDMGWLYVQATKLDLGDEDRERELAERVASRIRERNPQLAKLCGRMTMEQVLDRRRR